MFAAGVCDSSSAHGGAIADPRTFATDFYLKMVRLMEDQSAKHRPKFKPAWDRAVNRFVRELTVEFCDESGSILWERLTQFNSGRPNRVRSFPPVEKG